MAEFVEVMQKKEEMCKYYGTCMCCQLSYDNNHHEITCSTFMRYHPQEAEKIIMEWQKPVDWSKVKVDTPILVRDNEDKDWLKRHFAKYEDGKVFTWVNGATSWSTSETSTRWNYAKLVERKESRNE